MASTPNSTSDRVIANLLDQVDDLRAENAVLRRGNSSAGGASIEIGYWSIRGLGAPLRMMAAYAGILHDAKLYDLKPKEGGGWDASAWFDHKPSLKERNALMNLPYIIDGDTVVAQTNACFSYLGRKTGLNGATDAEILANEQCLCEVMDLRNAIVKVAYSGKDDGLAARIEGLAKSARGIYAKFELWLSQQGTDFFAATTPTACDFHIWECVDQLHISDTLVLTTDEFPLLKAFYDRVRALPQLQAYFDGELYALPMNNKMAAIGGTADPKAHLS